MVFSCQVGTARQSSVSRNINPIDDGVVTVGSIHGGTKHNIISDRAHLQLTVRNTNEETRKILLEGIEHMVDNANYTSVYPRMSLAPEQRFVSKGCYIARLSEDGSLVAVTDWLIPGSN